jgi:hypothetical protein
VPIDPDIGCRQCGHLVPGDEDATSGPDWPKLGDRLTVTCDDEALSRRHRIDHLRVLIAQLSLGDYLRHKRIA